MGCVDRTAATRTARFLGFLAVLTAIVATAIVALSIDGLVLVMGSAIWLVAWLDPYRFGLGQVTRPEHRIDQAVRPLYTQILAVPNRMESEAILVELRRLEPPSVGWGRVLGLLVDHLEVQLDHANPAYIPDRWRVVRAKELWERLLLRNVLASHRRQTPEEFDSELGELSHRFAAGVNAATEADRPIDAESVAAGTAEAETALAQMKALDPPGDAWRHVVSTQIAILEEDLNEVRDGNRPSRPYSDTAVRELQAAWVSARRGQSTSL